MNRKIKPIPTVYGEQILLSTAPSLLPAPRKIRKPPKERVSSIPDEIENFYEIDNIKSFEMLGETADGFSFKKFPDRVLFYRIFYEEDPTPYLESIEVDQDLHVKLHYKSCRVPLPAWFRNLNRCRMTSISMLQNFVIHMHNVANEWPYRVLEEIHKIMYFKQQGRPSPPYSPEV